MDISAYQNPTPSLAQQTFACVKASQATDEDVMWRTHSAAVRSAGLFLIAYHFGDGAVSISAQVQTFLRVAPYADAWVLDRDPTYYSQAYGREVPQPDKGQCREFINRMQSAGYPCGLYFNCANYIDVGQNWNWQASPPDFCPSVPWDIYQAHSGVPRGDIYRGKSIHELAGGDAVQTFVVNYDEPHTIHVPAHTTVYGLGGGQQRVTSEAKDQVGLSRGQLGGQGHSYWVVALQLEGDKQLTLVRTDDVQDKGKLGAGGGGGGGHSDTYKQGFNDARDKAITAVQGI